MVVYTQNISIKTNGEINIVDITGEIEESVKASKIENGIVSIFNAGSTGALTTIEMEHGLIQDFKKFLENTVPKGIKYDHNKCHSFTASGYSGNGHF